MVTRSREKKEEQIEYKNKQKNTPYGKVTFETFLGPFQRVGIENSRAPSGSGTQLSQF